MWLGAAAAAGATINYALSVLQRWQQYTPPVMEPSIASDADHPTNWKELLVFAFRELTRADFCFILLGLAAADAAWLLVPTAAVGAQAYWISLLFVWRKKYRV